MTKENVLKINNIIKDAQTKEIQLKTKIESEYGIAKKKFNCQTFEEIEKEIETRDKNLETIERKIDRKTKSLDEAYDWDL